MKLSSLLWVAGLEAGLTPATALSLNALTLSLQITGIHVGETAGRHTSWRPRKESNGRGLEQNNTKRATVVDRELWEFHKNRGCTLLMAMTASDKDAGGMISGTPVGTAESVFNNYPDDLTKWGYTFDTEAGEAFESGTGPEIDDAMRSLGIRYDEFDDDGPNYVTGWYHSKQTMHNNVVYPPTQARFRTIVNPEGGLIVGWLKYGLKFMGANLNPRVTQIPEFKNWADVAHLSWEIMCRMVGRDARNLRYIVSADIYNSETEALIAHSLQSTWTDDWKDTMCKRWEWKNKVEWDSSSEQFEVLLASPNGRGAAFMLIQHKSFYGEKRTIDKVTFWCTYTPDDDDEEEEGIWNLQLMFHVSQ